MWPEIRFAIYAIKKNIASSAELRTSFIMNIIGMALNNTAFIIVWVFFVKSVGTIGGWTAADIIGLLGFGTVSYGIVFSSAFGIRKIPDYVAAGTFDRFMLSPKNLLVRTATSAFSASAVGDIVFGIVCLGFYMVLIQASWIQIVLSLLLVIFSVLIFLAIAITIFATSFFFVDSGSVANSLFEVFLTPSLFHGGAFQGAMRFIFMFIIPSLLVGTIPVEAIKYISIEKLLLVGLLAIIWFVFSINFFRRAVRSYESSSFMSFGS